MSELTITASLADKGRDTRFQGQVQPPPGTAAGQVLTADGVGGSSWAAGGGSSFYQTMQDEGVDLTQRAKMNFVGTGVTATDSGTVTTVTIPGGGGAEIAFVQVTSNVAVTSTAEGTPDNIISLGAVTYNGNPVILTFYCANAFPQAMTTLGLIIELWDDVTYLERSWDFRNGTNDTNVPIDIRRRIVPSAGSHTYRFRGFRVGGAGSITLSANAGGGGSGTYSPIQMTATYV